MGEVVFEEKAGASAYWDTWRMLVVVIVMVNRSGDVVLGRCWEPGRLLGC